MTTAARKKISDEAKESRGSATFSMVNPSLPLGTTRQRRILAGGGFLHITETNP